MQPVFSRRYWPLLIVMTLALMLAGADAMSLKGCDEAFYARIAHEMARSGDWLTLRYQGLPNFEKPPLLIWLMAASFRLLGVGDLAARLPSLILGAASVFLVALLAERIHGDRRAGFLAGAMTLTTALFIQLDHQVMMDVPAFCFLSALVLGLWEMRRDAHWGWLVGPSLGLVILTKGALAVLLVAALLPWLVMERTRFPRALWLGLGVGLLPAVGWYGAMTLVHGAAFWRVHLGQQVIARAQSGLFVKDPLGPAFYAVHMLGTFLPWSPLLPVALAHGWKRARAGDAGARLALGFFAVYFLAISAMQTKFDHYALPLLLPSVLLYTSWLKDRWTSQDRHWPLATVYLLLGGAVMIASVLVATRVLRVPSIPGGSVTVALLGGLGLVWVGAGFLWLNRPARRSVGLLLAGTTGVYVLVATIAHPWDAEPGLRRVTADLPEGTPWSLVMPVAPQADFCAFAAAEFRHEGPSSTLLPAQLSGARTGWYVGRDIDVPLLPGDRVASEHAGWRLIRRP